MSNVLDIDSVVLGKGSHSSPEEGMCVMEAVSLMAGEGFTDAPSCASPVIRAFLVSWNDALPDDERQQLKQYIPRVIGTAGSAELEAKRAWMAADWLVRVQAPAWLRLAGLVEQADLLAGMPEVTPDTVPSIKAPLEAVRKDAAAAGAAARAAAGDAAWDAAGAAAWDAAWAAAAWDAAAWDAARAAAGAGVAAWDAAAAAAWAAVAARAAAGDAAWAAAAAWDAAGALRPTVTALQSEAHLLVDRLIRAEV